MTPQAENAIQQYQRNLARALEKAPRDVKALAVQDANEFLNDEVRAMDVGRLTSERAAYDRLADRFGSPDELAANYLEQAVSLKPMCTSHRFAPTAIAIVLLVAMSGGVCYAVLREPPKLSPFTDVQFDGENVLVTYKDRTVQWLELDAIQVDDIIAASKKQFGERWQKRISEDLVEVLWGMDHKPGDTVQLRLLDPKTNRDFVVEDAPMTKENRRVIWTKRQQSEEAQRRANATRRDPPKLSPFTDVQFDGEKVLVTYDGQAVQWLELDAIQVDDIIAASKKQFGERWQKRISEDLVEVLWGMDHKPGDTVQLRLLDPKTNRDFVVEDAPMTKENRRVIWTKRRQAEDSPKNGTLPDSASRSHRAFSSSPV